MFVTGYLGINLFCRQLPRASEKMGAGSVTIILVYLRGGSTRIPSWATMGRRQQAPGPPGIEENCRCGKTTTLSRDCVVWIPGGLCTYRRERRRAPASLPL